MFWFFVQLNLTVIPVHLWWMLEAQVFFPAVNTISASVFREEEDARTHRKVQAPRLVRDVVAHPSHAGMAKTP